MVAIMRGASALLVLSSAMVLVGAGPVSADTTYYPANSNGFRVYLSRACHDLDLGNDCVTNNGCDGYSENSRSMTIATQAKDELLSRGYPVRIGNGGAAANVVSSDSWNADLHVPLHSNAKGSSSCVSGASASNRGTEPQSRGWRATEIGDIAVEWIGFVSPGTNDRVIQNTTNHENWAPDAVPMYMEFEYHDWVPGENWLRTSDEWMWRLGATIDKCQGYPDSNGNPTNTKFCTW